MQQQSIHYPGYLVQYSLNKSGIESLIAGTVMLGGLEKVGWIVLKSRCNIQPFCGLENTLYDLNNQYPKQKNKWFSIDGEERKVYYNQNKNNDESRFIDGNIKEIHDLLKSDRNVIEEHLIQYYVSNVEKCISIIIRI